MYELLIRSSIFHELIILAIILPAAILLAAGLMSSILQVVLGLQEQSLQYAAKLAVLACYLIVTAARMKYLLVKLVREISFEV